MTTNPNTKWATFYTITWIAVGSENNYHTGFYSLGDGKWCEGRAKAKRYPTRSAAEKARRMCRRPTAVIKCISAITQEVEV